MPDPRQVTGTSNDKWAQKTFPFLFDISLLLPSNEHFYLMLFYARTSLSVYIIILQGSYQSPANQLFIVFYQKNYTAARSDHQGH